MADTGPRGAAAEPAIRDQGALVAEADALDRARGGKHFLHAGAAARAFVADDDDVAGFHLAIHDPIIGGLFRLEDMQKKVGQLSLGQRRKLEIARLMAASPNVLLLDEPTNYISLDVLEAFEAALKHFPGPVIAVSHDRWFIQRFGGQVWRIVDGEIVKE